MVKLDLLRLVCSMDGYVIETLQVEDTGRTQQEGLCLLFPRSVSGQTPALRLLPPPQLPQCGPLPTHLTPAGLMAGTECYSPNTASVLAAQTALCKVPLAWRLLICSFQRALWEGFTLGEASPLCQELRPSLSSEAWLSALPGKGKELEDAASTFVLRWVFPLVLAPCSTG